MKTYWIITMEGETKPVSGSMMYTVEEDANMDAEPEGFDVLEVHIIPAETVDKVREALQALRDEQNGPPLCNREAQWNEAMTMVEAALALLGSEGE